MNTAQDEDDDEEGVKLPGLPANAPNYMTPECYRRMLDERENLVRTERPKVVSIVSWAASERRPVPRTAITSTASSV